MKDNLESAVFLLFFTGGYFYSKNKGLHKRSGAKLRDRMLYAVGMSLFFLTYLFLTSEPDQNELIFGIIVGIILALFQNNYMNRWLKSHLQGHIFLYQPGERSRLLLYCILSIVFFFTGLFWIQKTYNIQEVPFIYVSLTVYMIISSLFNLFKVKNLEKELGQEIVEQEILPETK